MRKLAVLYLLYLVALSASLTGAAVYEALNDRIDSASTGFIASAVLWGITLFVLVRSVIAWRRSKRDPGCDARASR